MDDASSIVNRLFERSAKKGEQVKISKEEAQSFIKEEEELQKKCDESMQELTKGIEEKTLPLFVRPFARQLIKNLKGVKAKSESRVKEIQGSEGVKVEESAKKVEESAKKVEESAKKVEESTKKVEEGTKKVEESTKKPEETKKESPEAYWKEFTKSFKFDQVGLSSPFDRQKNLPSILLYSTLFAATLAFLLKGSSSQNNRITYDEFLKEFLYRGNVQEITLTEKGRIYVTIRGGKAKDDMITQTSRA